MLHDEKTFEQFGYNIHSLLSGSSKPIILTCDYCKNDYESTPKKRKIAHIKLATDACNKCKYIKRDAISPNPMKREEIKAKVRKTNFERYGSESITNSEHFKKKSIETNMAKYGVNNAMKNKEISTKQKQTFLEKYGVENPSQVEEFRKKVRETNLKKYGNEEFIGSEHAREKIENTVKEKYGVNNVFSNEDIKSKIRNTNLEKYGVEYPIQNPEIQEKVKITNLVNYGVENVLQSTEIKDRIKETNIERYGVEYPAQSLEIKERTKNSNLDKYGSEYPTQNKEIIDKIITTKISKGQIKIFNNKGMKEIASELNKAYSTFVKQVYDFGFEEAIKIPAYTNGLETVFANWLDHENIEYIQQFRVENRIADFYIPECNLLIELNGNFWHSDLVIEDDKYHINKRLLYEKNGYQCLFFREDEINSKFNIVKSIVLNKLKRSNKYYARKLIIKKVAKEEAKLFATENHLMGSGSGITYGLYMSDSSLLLSIIQVKNKSNNNLEISRFCNRLNTTVIGGFSRLLNHVIKELKSNSIITFIDNRYGTGSYLYDLGFQNLGCYPSFRWWGNNQVFHRLKFRGNIGYDKGLAKLWDCGQTKFVKFIGV